MVGPAVAPPAAAGRPSPATASRPPRTAVRTGTGQAPGDVAPADDAAPGLAVDHVSAVSLRGSLRDVSLEIAPGERVGVTGLLSAGVATLARVVAGAEPYESGRVLIDGRR